VGRAIPFIVFLIFRKCISQAVNQDNQVYSVLGQSQL